MSRKNQNNKKQTNTPQLQKEIQSMLNQLAQQEYMNQVSVELNSIGDYISKYTNGGVTEVKLSDLNNWLRNPQKHLDKLITLSRYFYAKDGLCTDIIDIFKTLPILNYSVGWQNMQMKKFNDYKKRADSFLAAIKPKTLARDTIFSVAQDGGCVWYLKNNKYVMFLEYDQIKIDTMINGKWRVDYDLAYFDTIGDLKTKQAMIESAPDEVTLKEYNAYNNKKDKNLRYVPLDINKTQTFKLRGGRNIAWYLPYIVGAISTIIHRDLLESTEKAMANRINNQIIIQTVGNTGSKDAPKPPSPESIKKFHEALKKIIQSTSNNNNYDNAGSAPLTVPEWVKLEELKIDLNVFPKEIYERIDRNIYQKLGYSPSINMGGGNGQSFGSGSINTEKIYSIINYIIEQIEEGITEYLNQIVSSGNFNPNIRFTRTTLMDKDTHVGHMKDLYTLGRGSLKYWVEATGEDFEHYLAQVEYENTKLDLNNLDKYPVHPSTYTDNGDNSGGRPQNKNTKDGNSSNDIPSPSD